MKTLVELPVDSKYPLVLLDFHAAGREPFGEYFFYYAADPAIVVNDKVDSTISEGSTLEVMVSFEKDVREVAEQMLHRMASGADGAFGENRAFLDSMLDRDIASWAEFNQKNILGALSVAGNRGTWFNYSNYRSPDFSFHFIKIDIDRVTKIEAYTNCKTTIPRALYARWERLIEAYRHIPYTRFTGAIRM